MDFFIPPLKIIQRHTNDAVVVEGRLAVEALIDSDLFQTESVFLEEGRHGDLLQRAKAKGLNCVSLSREEIVEEAGFPFHRGVFATARRPEMATLTAEKLSRFSKILMPINLADGGNLGTLIRTAVAFGCDAVVLEVGKGTDVYSRKCIRASATAIFRVPVFEISDLGETLTKLKHSGFNCYATGLHADSVPPREIVRIERSAILFGPEKDGLTDDLILACDQCIRIPMEQGMDSLNVAASGAIIMYEIFGAH